MVGQTPAMFVEFWPIGSMSLMYLYLHLPCKPTKCIGKHAIHGWYGIRRAKQTSFIQKVTFYIGHHYASGVWPESYYFQLVGAVGRHEKSLTKVIPTSNLGVIFWDTNPNLMHSKFLGCKISAKITMSHQVWTHSLIREWNPLNFKLWTAKHFPTKYVYNPQKSFPAVGCQPLTKWISWKPLAHIGHQTLQLPGSPPPGGSPCFQRWTEPVELLEGRWLDPGGAFSLQGFWVEGKICKRQSYGKSSGTWKINIYVSCRKPGPRKAWFMEDLPIHLE